MAAVRPLGRGLDLSVDWERGVGVAAPELAATWCALEISVDGRPVTLVQDERGAVRRRVHTSAYPLAEWIASRWWFLRAHVRPTSMPAETWTWDRVSTDPWLRHHNLRAAGNGMPWPDATLVPEGAVTRIVWRGAAGLAQQPVSFLTSGDVHLPADDVRRSLALFVTQVTDRLEESGVAGTWLQQEWAALAGLDEDEKSFAAAAARLGLDVFDVDEQVADDLVALGGELEDALLAEFLDSADPGRLRAASYWLGRASRRIVPGEQPRAQLPTSRDVDVPRDARRPWAVGYELARASREHLGLDPEERIDVRALVGVSRVGGDAAGLRGLMGVVADGIGVALPHDVVGASATRFAQARALGLSLLTDRTSALLDPAGTESAQSSRAFAAELLAPAAGIGAYFRGSPAVTDAALDALARHFGTSPLVVWRQYDNQLT